MIFGVNSQKTHAKDATCFNANNFLSNGKQFFYFFSIIGKTTVICAGISILKLE